MGSEDWEALRELASSLLDARLADIVITAIDTPGYNDVRVYRRKRRRDAEEIFQTCFVLEMCLSPLRVTEGWWSLCGVSPLTAVNIRNLRI